MDRFAPKASASFRFFTHLFLTASCLGLPFSSLAASGELTLDHAMSEAQASSPQLKKAQSAEKEAESRKTETYSGFLPTLSASANYLFDKKYMFLDVQLPPSTTTLSIPQIVPAAIASLDARWTLFDGFSNVNHYRAASRAEQAARDEAGFAKFQIERQVVLSFYRALAAQTLRAVAEQNLKTIEDHQKDANLLRKAGVSTKYDVLRVDVQVSEARSELLNSQDMVDTAKGHLAETIGEENEERTLMGALPEPEPAWMNGAEHFDLTDRKDLHAATERVESLNFQKASASAHWSPRVGLFGSYQYYNNRNGSAFDSQAFRDAYQVGIALSWSLFDGLADVARERQAVEQAVQAEAGLRMNRLHAKQDFDYWRKRFAYFCSVYKARVSDIDKSSESVRLAKEGRRAGTRTNTELLDAELELFRARAGVVNAQMGAVEALINLELATGRQLHSFQ